MPAERPPAALEITVRWLKNEDQAPAAVRRAVEELVHVLNEHGLDTAERNPAVMCDELHHPHPAASCNAYCPNYTPHLD